MKMKILILCLLSFLVYSCNVTGVDSLYLGTVKIQTVRSGNDLVPYPNVDFAIPSFISGFVEGFNKKQEELPSDTLVHPPIKNPLEMNSSDFTAVVNDNQYTFLKNNFDYSKLSDESKQFLLRKGFADFWLSLDLKTNLWQQRIWGTLTIYLNGSVFYRKNADVVSKYIILDKDSPYASSLDKQLNIKPKGDYEEEIKYIYKDLGFLFAQKIKKDFVNVCDKDEYMKKQEVIRAFYEAEKRSTATVPSVQPSEIKENPVPIKKQKDENNETETAASQKKTENAEDKKNKTNTQ